MAVSIFINLVGFLLFTFLVWKRLREDYSRDTIFGLGFLVVSGLILGNLLSKYFTSGFWFWGEIAGILLGLAVSLIKFRLRFYETLEALILGSLAWFGFFWLVIFLRNPVIVSFLMVLLIACLLVLFGLFEANYKDFSWYHSGKVGFSGLTVAAIFFLARAVIASFFPTLLSFAGRSEVFLAASCSFLLFLLVYNLSRKEV